MTRDSDRSPEGRDEGSVHESAGRQASQALRGTSTQEAVRLGHTPGPWFVDGPAHNQIVWSDIENRVCFLAHSDGADEERDLATGRLIAAAPELLDIVRSIIFGDPNGNFQFMMAGNPNAQDQYLARINALLSRIEGASHNAGYDIVKRGEG